MENELLDATIDRVEPLVTESVSSSVWSYFKKTKEAHSAVCSRCGTSIQCKGGTTSGMRTHLKLKHGIALVSITSESSKGIDMNVYEVSRPVSVNFC